MQMTDFSFLLLPLLRAMNPKVSKVGENVFWPSGEIALWVGFIANTPVKEAGRIRLPPVVPSKTQCDLKVGYGGG